jgi:hypothetical protein
MPQLLKGAKWVYGWVVVGGQGELTIPPEAWDEYGFFPGEEAAFMPGSRSSGGLGLSSPRLLARMSAPLAACVQAWDRIGDYRRIVLPPSLGVRPGDRLVVVRGSGRALGFVARGPIYDEAVLHSGLEILRSPSLLK